MGYYVTLEDVNFTIPADNLDAAYEAMCALNVTHDDKKTGGSWSGGQQTGKWFAWMDENYPDTCKDAAAIFEALGFEYEVNPEGDLTLTYYDSKAGAEDLFIEAVGKYALGDWYLVWRGEDGDTWQQTGTGTERMLKIPATRLAELEAAAAAQPKENSEVLALLRRAVFPNDADAKAAAILTGGVKDGIPQEGLTIDRKAFQVRSTIEKINALIKSLPRDGSVLYISTDFSWGGAADLTILHRDDVDADLADAYEMDMTTL